MVKTTKRHFKYFCDSVNKWVEKLGLTEWEICFDHTELEQCFASIKSNYLGKVVTVAFNTEWDDRIIALTDSAIEDTAKHEVLELLIDDARTIANSRFVQEDEIVNAFHVIIRRLEKVL